MKKNIYVVVGMARSGTSAIARGLKALGIDLGENLEAPNPLWNPKGFFEDIDIVFKINRGVLFALKFSWLSVNMLDSLCADDEKLSPFKAEATQLLKQRMEKTNHWGFKDPRTAMLLPFWKSVFQKLDVNENYVIALRNPLASAYSYQRVSGVDLEVGLLLWLMHMVPAIDGSHGKHRIMVSYDAMLKSPDVQLERIRQFFNIEELGNQEMITEYTQGFLDKSLQHYEYTEEDLKNHAAARIAPICSKMYAFFLRLAKDELSFESEAFRVEWAALREEFNHVYPIYGYVDVLLKKNKKLERKLRTIHRSIPWKLTYPLRLIDDALRAKRQKNREKRRLLSYG